MQENPWQRYLNCTYWFIKLYIYTSTNKKYSIGISIVFKSTDIWSHDTSLESSWAKQFNMNGHSYREYPIQKV